MLKIREGIDLKELEKFGFEKDERKYDHFTGNNGGVYRKNFIRRKVSDIYASNWNKRVKTIYKHEWRGLSRIGVGNHRI